LKKLHNILQKVVYGGETLVLLMVCTKPQSELHPLSRHEREKSTRFNAGLRELIIPGRKKFNVQD